MTDLCRKLKLKSQKLNEFGDKAEKEGEKTTTMLNEWNGGGQTDGGVWKVSNDDGGGEV